MGEHEPESTDATAATAPRVRRGASARLLMTVAVTAAMLAVVALVGLFQAQSRISELEDQSVAGASLAGPSANLFDGPGDLGALLEEVQASTVTIGCKDSQGSGWVIELSSPDADAGAEAVELDREFPTEVITNHHVIDECVDTPRKVTATAGGTTYDAVLYSYDEENDLALIAIKQDVPPLKLSEKPEPGWWAVAVGTPYGLEGSVSIGNIMNLDGNDVIANTPLNSGNSGGPLVNAHGEVIGTATWVMIGDDEPQDWNVAVSHRALCDKLADCAGDSSWE